MSTCPRWKKRVNAVNAVVSSHLCLIAVEAGNKSNNDHKKAEVHAVCFQQEVDDNQKQNEG